MEGSKAKGTTETLLPKNSVSTFPIIHAKLIICNRISPEYSKGIIDDNFTIREAFNPTNTLIQSLAKNHNSGKNLLRFLQATENLPRDKEGFPAPFYFLKGPDQLLRTPFGLNIHYLLEQGDSEGLLALKDSDGNTFELKSLATVFEYHCQKYKSQSYILLNSSKAYLDCINSRSAELDSEKVLLLAKVINQNESFLLTLDLEKYHIVSIKYADKEEVLNSQLKMDSIYEDIMNGKRKLEENTEKEWIISYLIATLGQPKASSRNAPNGITFEDLIHPKIIKAMGNDYPREFGSGEPAILAANWLLEPPENLEKEVEIGVKEIINKNLSEIKNLENITGKLNQLADNTIKRLDSLLKIDKNISEELHRISYILTFFPTDKELGQADWQRITTHVAKQGSHLINKAKRDSASGILDLALTISENSSVVDANISAIVQQITHIIKIEDLESCCSQWNENVFLDHLLDIAPDQTLNLVNNQEFVDFVIKNSSQKFRDWIIQIFPNINTRNLYIEKFKEEKDTQSINKIIKSFKIFSGQERIVVSKMAIEKAQESRSEEGHITEQDVSNIFKDFISNPDASTRDLIKLIKEHLDNKRYDFAEYARTILEKNKTNWSTKEILQLEWAISAPDQISESLLKNLIDQAIGLACTNAVGKNIREGAFNLITDLWITKTAFNLDLFKKLHNVVKAMDGYKDKMLEVLQANKKKISILDDLDNK